VSHVYDVTSANQSGVLLVGQIDGSITVINYLDQTRIL